MMTNSQNIFKKVEELEAIILEQQRIIELLKERLSDLANDVDRNENKGKEYGYYSYYRSDTWNW